MISTNNINRINTHISYNHYYTTSHATMPATMISATTAPEDKTVQMSAAQALMNGPAMLSNNKRTITDIATVTAAVVSDDETSDSEDEAPQQQQQQVQEERPCKRQRTRKQKKSVQFAEFALYRPIPSRHEYHPEMLLDMFRTYEDMRQTKIDIVQTIRSYNETTNTAAATSNGVNNKEEGETSTIRGLEKYIPSQSAGRTQRIRQSIALVLHMQAMKAGTASDIARAYQRETAPSVCCAYMRGSLDERIEEDITEAQQQGMEGLQLEIFQKYSSSIAA
eukprot:CAMPEP_0198113692 /NCGR_PEP_ID=MMETSP1442-20131203/5303_1 /TAXON_ID= /ORGANISM="Craspedostauros australis, Strain CCMP3328" /LENGTH=278 /DNA_ID=CAMNT_0043770861 /DNA_START=19 /DNA_END=855 /DNA_ORIENTATION=+